MLIVCLKSPFPHFFTSFTLYKSGSVPTATYCIPVTCKQSSLSFYKFGNISGQIPQSTFKLFFHQYAQMGYFKEELLINYRQVQFGFPAMET